MDILFLILGFFLMLIGIIGSILPILPGTPISWLGLVLLFLAPSLEFDWTFITITGIIAFLIYILDYIIPAIGTKKFGGSRAGVWGTTLGLIIGIFTLGPFGILIGPFVGALIGELVFNESEGPKALKAATGSFIGFLTSTFLKFVATFSFLLLFIAKVWEYRAIFF